jgi:NADPH:quinone reductase-like Zn-dependent oxidoreductase
VDFDDGAVAPVAGLSAVQLVAMIGARAGQRILVHGAAGGIGSFVVPLLRDRGATVVATGSARSQAFLGGLQPDLQLDYAAPLADWGAPYDAVIDCASRLDAATLAHLLPHGGPVAVTLPSFPGMIFDPLLNPLRRVRRLTLRLAPSAAALEQLLATLADGRIRARVTRRTPLAQAQEALLASRTGHVQGKWVIVP